MKYTSCENCGKTNIPLNSTVKIDNKVFCEDCIKQNFQTEEQIKGKSVEHQFDETVCSQCSKDFGDTILKKVSVYPICGDCEKKIRNKTFPFWVKAFLSGILLITVFSFFWNWKYFNAYKDLEQSYEYLNKGNIEKAFTLISSVKSTVPEDEGVNLLYRFFNGINLLTKDKTKESLKEFEFCKGKMPENFDVDGYILQSKIGIAFDDKNYEDFLNYSKEILKKNPKDSYSMMSVASAYSCIYVEKNDESAKTQALNYIEQAKKINSKDKEIIQYYSMVLYRIYNKTIITSKEFNNKFPNGWTKN